MSANVVKSDLDLNSDAVPLDERNDNETRPLLQTLIRPLSEHGAFEGSADDSSSKRVIEMDDIGQIRVCGETQDRKACKDQIEALFGDSSPVDGDSGKEERECDQKNPILIVGDDGGGQKMKTQVVDSTNGESCDAKEDFTEPDEKKLVLDVSADKEIQVLDGSVGNIGEEIGDDGSQVEQVETVDVARVDVLEENTAKEAQVLEAGDGTVGEEIINDNRSQVNQVETVDDVQIDVLQESSAKEIKVLEVGVRIVGEEIVSADRCEVKQVETVDVVQVDVLEEIVAEDIQVLEAGASVSLPAEDRNNCAVITEIESSPLDKKQNTVAQVAEGCSSLQNGGEISDSPLPDQNPDTGANVVASGSLLNGGQNSIADVTESKISQPDGNQDIGAQVPGENRHSSVQITEPVNIVPDENLNQDQKLTIPLSEVEETRGSVVGGDENKGVEVSESEICIPNRDQTMETPVQSTEPVNLVPDATISLRESEAGSLVPDMEISLPNKNRKGGNIVIDLGTSHADEKQNTGDEVIELGLKGEISQRVEVSIDAEKSEDHPDLVEQTMEIDRKNHVSHYQYQENQFSSADLVWGKVKSHPWWPGQIFDSSDSSEKAMKYQKKDNFLVAYFGDRTFAWCDKTQLKPFRANFVLMERQGNTDSFLNSVDSALDEVSRRVELGLACSCLPESSRESLKSQEVVNAGIREGVTIVDAADKSFSVTSFESGSLLDYIKELALFTTIEGINRLEFTVARAQLTAYYRAKGYSKLPLFGVYGGLLENDAEYELPNRTCLKNSALISMDEEQISVGLVSENGGRGNSDSPSRKRKHILDDGLLHTRKQKSLSELMAKKKARRGFNGGRAQAHKRVTSKSVSPSVGSNKHKKTKDSFSAPSVGTKKLKKTNDSVSSDWVQKRRKKRKRISSLSYRNIETPTSRRSFKKDSFSAYSLRNRDKKRLDSLSDPDFETPTTRRSSKDEPFSFESLRNRKRKRLASLSDADVKTPATRGSFKVGECISRIANQLTGSPPIIKPRRESFRKNEPRRENQLTESPPLLKPRRESFRKNEPRRENQLTESSPILKPRRESFRKNEPRRENQLTESLTILKPRRESLRKSEPRRESLRKNAVKVERSRIKNEAANIDSSSTRTPENRRRISIPKEGSSPDDMLSQLYLTARDPMKGYNFLSVIIGFFSGFRNSINQDGSSSREQKSEEKVGGKSGRRKSSSSKAHSPDDVKDSYWTDRIIFSSPEEPLQRTRKRKGEFKLQTPTKKRNRQTPSGKPARSPRHRSKLDTEHETGSEKQVGNSGGKEENSPTTLILTFTEGGSLPSEIDLCKIFSRYGSLKESETEVLRKSNRCSVVFERRSDAETAFSSAGKSSLFGPALVTYRVRHLTSPSKVSSTRQSRASTAAKP